MKIITLALAGTVLLMIGLLAAGCVPRARAARWSNLAYLSGRLDADKSCVELLSQNMDDDDRRYIAAGREDVDNMDVLAEESVRETDRKVPYHGQ